MKAFTLADVWRRYLLEAIPNGAPATQIKETRRAFYAGASAVFFGLLSSMTESDDTVEEEDLALMAGITEELAEFAADVAEGRA